ncbi:hypothetical protein V1T75_07960 [Tenacibaculum sp. FZY0031]|nr:hypothetical protein [Tenacibaculum sp. FZY0031]
MRNLQKRNENAKKAEKVINETKDNTLKEMTNNSLKKLLGEDKIKQ